MAEAGFGKDAESTLRRSERQRATGRKRTGPQALSREPPEGPELKAPPNDLRRLLGLKASQGTTVVFATAPNNRRGLARLAGAKVAASVGTQASCGSGLCRPSEIGIRPLLCQTLSAV